MPEGPSLIILKEAVMQFKGKKVLKAGGSSITGFPELEGQTIVDFKSWGKHFLICFKTFSIRIHMLLFGTYRINERKEAKPRLSLCFKNGELNFYTCSVRLIEEDLDDVYDWSADVMGEKWSPAKTKKKLQQYPEMLACDALMNQDIFSGVGNIIKNEVLFRIRVHPQSKVGEMPSAKINAMVKEAVVYSFQFLEWKKAFELKKHWLIYNQKTCPRDNVPFIKKNMGRTNRKTFFCPVCQELYE